MRAAAPLALAALLALAACGAAPQVCPPELTKYVYEPPVPIPPALLAACPAPPMLPPDGSLQSAGDQWDAKMVIAYESCREGYGAIAAFQAAHSQPAAAPPAPAQAAPAGAAPATAK